MVKETPFEKTPEASNERAVAWARRMMANKRVKQERMQEEFDGNSEAQKFIAELFKRNKKTNGGL